MLDRSQQDSRLTMTDSEYKFAYNSYSRPSYIIYSMIYQFSVEKLPSSLKHGNITDLSVFSLALLMRMGISPLFLISYMLPFFLLTYLFKTKRQSEIKPLL
jgi:hypothetical protein